MKYSSFVTQANKELSRLRKESQTWLEASVRMKISGGAGSAVGIRQYKITLIDGGHENDINEVSECEELWVDALSKLLGIDCQDFLKRKMQSLGCQNPDMIMKKLHNESKAGSHAANRVRIRSGFESMKRKVTEKGWEGFDWQDVPVELQPRQDEELEPTIRGVKRHLENYLNKSEIRRVFGPECDEAEEIILSRLGFYRPSQRRIYIILPAVFRSAGRSSFLTPLELFETVLVHEMAHCLHHCGIDRNSRQWDDFGYAGYGKPIVEGLANYHTARYFWDKGDLVGWYSLYYLSPHPKSPYSKYRSWLGYQFENIHMRLVELRNPQNRFKGNPKDFDIALINTHRRGDA